MLILALDAGTTCVKAILVRVDQDGLTTVICAAASPALPLPRAPMDNGAEQDAHEWWDAACAAVQSLPCNMAKDVQLVALSGQMQSTLLLDSKCCPCSPALLYCDARGTKESEALEQRLGLERLKSDVENWKGASSVLPKLRWLLTHSSASILAASMVRTIPLPLIRSTPLQITTDGKHSHRYGRPN